MNKLLIVASRQYMHNDGSGLVCGFDKIETEKIVGGLQEKLRLADMLINKIDDKKYKQMIAKYRTLTKAN